MSWIKEVIVDLIVSVFIIAAIFVEVYWMRWVVIGYTGILLFAKLIVLAGDSSLQLIRKTKTSAPEWFNHVLYALNTCILIYAQWWYLAAGWAMIWILSFRAERKLKTKKGKV